MIQEDIIAGTELLDTLSDQNDSTGGQNKPLDAYVSRSSQKAAPSDSRAAR